MVLARVRHREQFGKFATVARDQPVFVVGDLALDRVLLDEVGDDFDDQVFRQRIQVQLNRVRDANAPPVVVEVNLDRLVFLLNVTGEQILDARSLVNEMCGP